MSNKLFSVVLLASLFTASSSLLIAHTPASVAPVAVQAPEVKDSAVTRAYNAVASTANSAASGVRSAVVKTAATSAAVAASIYGLAWANKGWTLLSLATLSSILLYNYNETFKAKVDGLFGEDGTVCSICPASCDCLSSSESSD